MLGGDGYPCWLAGWLAGYVDVLSVEDGKRCLVCGTDLEDRTAGRQTDPQDTLPFGLGLPGLPGSATPNDFNTHDLRNLVLRLFSEIGGQASDNDARRPASQSAITKLGSFTADQASTIEVAAIVQGIKGEVIAIPANFGPCHSVADCTIVLGDPIDGAQNFANASLVKGSIVVLDRGAVTFAQKVIRAQKAGAVAVIIIQNVDVWPYTMTDSKGESAGLTIPAFMMSMKQGQGFVDFLRSKLTTSQAVRGEILVRKDARECVICQVEMAIGMQVTRMPCQHLFHTDCLHEWFKVGNSCPICRVEIPAERPSHSATSALNAQERGDFAWSDWFG
ncbi:TPA: hypothetical protein N0F65_000070 [Lagenidium giganteum]|uniref:RING-type E3 ubiquitin transferase n=1 Tax=Lagenidium giganteum TaxID=4803 RepID=A0AAV2YL40_9STRA|nr:TPA: hypothetical protein N0F65_000070 [Lagenidium giganteum]